jgi:hypothetical protein
MNQISNSKFTDPDPVTAGQIIMDPANPDPQHWIK